jgi:hypothetical protein
LFLHHVHHKFPAHVPLSGHDHDLSRRKVLSDLVIPVPLNRIAAAVVLCIQESDADNMLFTPVDFLLRNIVSLSIKKSFYNT